MIQVFKANPAPETRERERIHLWADMALRLEHYFTSREPISGQDVRFLALLGDSVYLISQYNVSLRRRLQCRDERESGDWKPILRYFEFHNDLVVSKIKHFFFREVPNQHLNPIYLSPDREIHETGKRLWQLSESGSLEDCEYYLCRYLHALGLFYAFVYDSFRDQGVFLHFRNSKETFLAVARLLEGRLEGVRDEFGLRDFINRMVPMTLQLYLARAGYEKPPASNTVRRAYSEFVRCFAENESIFVEPLGWHLLDVLIKLDGLLQDALECRDLEQRKKFEEDLVGNTKDFILKWLAGCREMYESGQMDYRRMFSIEARWMTDVVYEKVFWRPKRNDVRQAHQRLGELEHAEIRFSAVSLGCNARAHGDAILFRLRGLPERDLKIESLLEMLSPDEVLALFQSYARPFALTREATATALVGFYSSGVFLAHMVNLFRMLNGAGNISQMPNGAAPNPAAALDRARSATPRVWMFKVFPYMATHPIHEDEDDATRPDHVAICDESIKTGFTYSAYENYLKRHLPTVREFSIATLFAHENYVRVDTRHKPDIFALFKVRATHEIEGRLADLLLVRPEVALPRDWASFEKRLEASIKIGDRNDFTYMIADTGIALGISSRFAASIEEQARGRPVFIYSPSREGRVLAMLTGFWLRMRRTEISFRRERAEESYRVLIDLTRVTGFTASFHWELFTDAEGPPGPLDQCFDSILSIG